MMSLPVIHVWKKAPFIRWLIPLITGITLQWYFQFSRLEILIAAGISIVLLTIFFSISFFRRFRLSTINGFAIGLLIASLGAFLTWYKDIRNDQDWFGKNYDKNSVLVVSLTEKPIEKTKSFKADAKVDIILKNDSIHYCSGNIIIYFQKDSLPLQMDYGSRLIIDHPLQDIKNSGNPGGFDYKRYSLFHGITHQVYVKENNYRVLTGSNKIFIKDLINKTRVKVLTILRNYIHGEKELGLAEALLIGYKDDLDKNLVQSYSNTGVVHIIAISGLHLGLVYLLLGWILRPLYRKKNMRWLRSIIMLFGLWAFTLLAGAQPSVVRSAVMFSCIILSESLSRKTSIFNTLALSAFILLCIDPFWLWDVGFQLSYAAVLSIVVFMKPIYHWFYIKNKILDFIWKLNAVTIAAQIFTIPLSIYHFHQFPLSFLFTNFLAVPLSSLILFAEIFLCIFSFVPLVASILGKILAWLIWLMNSYIERIEALPYALWDGLQISVVQTLLLIAIGISLGNWLLEKKKNSFWIGLISIFAFFILRSISFVNANNRNQLIVYNVPQKVAIDIIDGREFNFIGDSDLLKDDFIRNFHLKPSRILKRLIPSGKSKFTLIENNYLVLKDKKIILLDSVTNFTQDSNKIDIDLLIISGNPPLYLKKLAASSLRFHQVVFDGSCPSWKTAYWKKDCLSLNIPFHDVSEKGAFVMNF